MKYDLGQYMTPQVLADYLGSRIKNEFEEAVDLAVGNGMLLNAVASQAKCLIGVDIDQGILASAKTFLPRSRLIHGDGIQFQDSNEPPKSRLIIGNPPYGESLDNIYGLEWINKAFPDVSGKSGKSRLEIQFLARALCLLKTRNDLLIMILPSGFADGEKYRSLRKSLCSNYDLINAMEVPEGVFLNTEAKTTVLTVRLKENQGAEVSTNLTKFVPESKNEELVYSAILQDGQRLDASYYGMKSCDSHTTLGDIGVLITRGKQSRKEAERLNKKLIHTTDLNNNKSDSISFRNDLHTDKNNSDIVYAKKGDVLLPRTGSRVSWRPHIVKSGSAPITDHVFCIRPPSDQRDRIHRAFRSDNFSRWVSCVSKGVCAAVLTKRDLLEMPLF